MYNRQLLNELEKWKNKDHRKPLVLRGARQVGKTTLVNEFGRSFDNYIYMNLEIPENADVFRHYTNVEDVINFISLKFHVSKSKDKSTLLFLDEIQEEEKAVGMLRYFYEDYPWIHVVAAGSRLQTLKKKHVSFPVGRVEYMSLRPFSFPEFLGAVKGDEWVNVLDSLQISGMLHSEMMQTFCKYALVGGMPEAVSMYAENKDIEQLSNIYRSLQNGYMEDVERYAKSPAQVAVMRHILRHGWAYAGEAIKFVKFAGSEYSSTQIHEAMDVLQRAFILSLDYPVTSVAVPAVPSYGHSPKLVWVDTGIVNFFADIQIEYLQNKDLLDTWRGRAAEHIVAQELRVVLDRHFRDEQYYWVRDKKGTSAEIDFVWQYHQNLIPIEVKAGNNSHLRSLHSFVKNSDKFVTAIRVWSGEYSVQEATTPEPDNIPFRLINVPFYLVCKLDMIIEQNVTT